MAVAVKEFEKEKVVEDRERIARLEEKAEHIQSDLTELKSDVRRLDSKIDDVGKKVDAVKEDTHALGLELRDSFAKQRMDRVIDRIWWLMISAALLSVMARGMKWI